MKIQGTISVVGICLGVAGLGSSVNASSVLLSEVPMYKWYHGCGPTAAASILGYWDMHGYDNLFAASGWDDLRLTQNVQDEISSPGHNARYGDHPGDVEDFSVPVPPDTSIADFFKTSENGLAYGANYQHDAPGAFTDYAAYKGYSDWTSEYEIFENFLFEDVKSEIDNGSPMMFLVDSNGDGDTDHFVPVIGYNDETLQYAFYTNWYEEETVSWRTYQGMSSSWSWGVSHITRIIPGLPDSIGNEVPEPTTLLLFGLGIAGVIGCQNKRKG